MRAPAFVLRAEAQVAAADCEAPTERHAHDILGDAVEWGALRMPLAVCGLRGLIAATP